MNIMYVSIVVYLLLSIGVPKSPQRQPIYVCYYNQLNVYNYYICLLLLYLSIIIYLSIITIFVYYYYLYLPYVYNYYICLLS